jgi:hypothetical protein
MASTLQINPMLTTNAAGSFRNLSGGFIQGVAMDDPAIRNSLANGVLKSSDTLPMWGGVAISEFIALPESSTAHTTLIGNDVARATTLSNITGFSVFDQAHNMITTPQNTVPLALANMSVNFYRLGCGARIPVRCSSSLIALRSGLIAGTTLASWDFQAQELVPYTPAYVANPITGAVWANTAGGQVTYTVTNDLSAVLSAGSVIDVTGVVNTGGTGTGVYNGTFVVVSVTSTTIVVTYVAAASPGTYASGGSVAAGGGNLPVKVLTILDSNCRTVNYNAATGFATWNENDLAALILI